MTFGGGIAVPERWPDLRCVSFHATVTALGTTVMLWEANLSAHFAR